MYCNGNLVFSIAQPKQNPFVDTFQKNKKQTNHLISLKSQYSIFSLQNQEIVGVCASVKHIRLSFLPS